MDWLYVEQYFFYNVKVKHMLKQCRSCLFQNETNARVKNVTFLVEDDHYCHLKQYRVTYELNVNNVTAVWHNASTGRVFFFTQCQWVLRPYTGSYTPHCYVFEAVVNSFVYFKAWPETSSAVIFVLYEGITYFFKYKRLDLFVLDCAH
jgi:hypothetical protein